MRLTKSTLGSLVLPPNKKDHTFYDSDLRGFGLRVRDGGKRTWVAIYRIGPKSRRVSIGDASAVAPEEARSRAREILAKADLGQDSQTAKEESRSKRVLDFHEAVDAYIDRHVEVRLRARSQEEVKRHLRVHWRTFHKLPLPEIGIQPHVIEAVVNHLSGHKGGIAGVYNRASYAEEK